MRWPGFVGGSNTSQSLTANAEKTVNLYVERYSTGAAASEAALLPTPGFQAWGAVRDVFSRGAVLAGMRLFWVIGPTLYEFSATGVATNRGTVALDGNPAQLIYNGVVAGQIGILSAGKVYVFTLATNVLSAAVLTGGYTHLSYAGGYGLAFDPTTGRTRVSNVNDLSTWDALNFFTRSLFADPIQAQFVDANNLVWNVGTETFEVRYNGQIGTQPFVPLSGMVGRTGIAAPFAYAVTRGAGNFWLSQSQEGIGDLVQTQGSVPQSVNSTAVNTAIAGYLRTGPISDAEILVHQLEGHPFVVTAFPTAKATWAYDAKDQSWAERGRWNSPMGTYDLWAPRTHVRAFGKSLVGDRTTGTIWQMDTAFATDVDGTGIRRLRRSPHLNKEHQRLPIDQFELLADVGLGLPTGQGSDPQVMLRISDDGGRTWSNEQPLPAGRIGEWPKRIIATRLGTGKLGDRVIEVSWSEPVPMRIVDAWVNNAEKVA